MLSPSQLSRVAFLSCDSTQSCCVLNAGHQRSVSTLAKHVDLRHMVRVLISSTILTKPFSSPFHVICLPSLHCPTTRGLRPGSPPLGRSLRNPHRQYSLSPRFCQS